MLVFPIFSPNAGQKQGCFKNIVLQRKTYTVNLTAVCFVLKGHSMTKQAELKVADEA